MYVCIGKYASSYQAHAQPTPSPRPRLLCADFGPTKEKMQHTKYRHGMEYSMEYSIEYSTIHYCSLLSRTSYLAPASPASYLPFPSLGHLRNNKRPGRSWQIALESLIAPRVRRQRPVTPIHRLPPPLSIPISFYLFLTFDVLHREKRLRKLVKLVYLE